ncbi:MAG: hypothetical protein ACI4R9_03695 [Kiritimatiellia bacterium]
MDPEVMDFYDENVTRMIAEKYGYTPAEALPLFLSSRTYRMLADPKMEMWQFGPPGIFDMWESERVTGTPLNSPYLKMA